MLEVTILTDESCIGNPGPGGWACLLRCGNLRCEPSSRQSTIATHSPKRASLRSSATVPAIVERGEDRPIA
jgi:ribonuclease HI